MSDAVAALVLGDDRVRQGHFTAVVVDAGAFVPVDRRVEEARLSTRCHDRAFCTSV
jgi:hypothetical protein